MLHSLCKVRNSSSRICNTFRIHAMTERKRSAASEAAARHWAKRSKPVEVIEITSEDEDRPPPVHHHSKTSPIQLLYNPSYGEDVLDKVNKDTVLIDSLIGTKDLEETYQFNFNVDLGFILTYFHPDVVARKKQITFITGSDLLDKTDPDYDFITTHFNIKHIRARLVDRFGTHHTKMMINFFEDYTCEVVIMTCNLTKLDFGGLTQMLWRSGRLKLLAGEEPATGARFKRDLVRYLNKYRTTTLNTLAQRLKKYDFLPVQVELLASAPGIYDLKGLDDETDLYGYGKLYQILKRNDLLVDNTDGKKLYNFLGQVTSISYPFSSSKGQTASVFSHLLCPLVFSKNRPFTLLKPGGTTFQKHQVDNSYRPHLIFPSVKDISNSNTGFGSGQAIHFNYTKSKTHEAQYEQNVKPYLRRWSTPGIVTGRELVPPHVKLFICDNTDNWSTLKWVLLGSHNLSKQAWGIGKGAGSTTTDPSQYEISSYELGVIVIPREGRLVPSYGSDTIHNENVTPIRLPFQLPPTNYEADDKPWSMYVDHGSLQDKFGNTYSPF